MRLLGCKNQILGEAKVGDLELRIQKNQAQVYNLNIYELFTRTIPDLCDIQKIELETTENKSIGLKHELYQRLNLADRTD